MTNTNELTAKLKAAAKDAADNFDPVIGVLTRDILALTEALEAAGRRNAELEDLLDAEIRSWSQRYDCANSRREAAERRSAELEASHAKLRDTMAAIHNTIRLDGAYTPLGAIMSNAKRAYEESASIASLEARALTVKLPVLAKPMDGTGYAHYAGAEHYRQRVINALTFAGIKLQIEGE